MTTQVYESGHAMTVAVRMSRVRLASRIYYMDIAEITNRLQCPPHSAEGLRDEWVKFLDEYRGPLTSLEHCQELFQLTE